MKRIRRAVVRIRPACVPMNSFRIEDQLLHGLAAPGVEFPAGFEDSHSGF
jgi:hypothetical protein